MIQLPLGFIVPTHEQRFALFDAANPRVYELFERFALEKASTRTHYSADAIMHRVRWECDAVDAEDGSGFRVNNNFVTHYARKFEQAHPECVGFFRFRRAA